MGYQRGFDPEIGDESIRACINDGGILGAKSYALAVTTTGSTSIEVAPGLYRVFLAGGDPSVTVALRTGASGVEAEFPTTGSPGTTTESAVFPGSAVERVRVLPGASHVAARSLGSGGTLCLVALVMT